MRAPLLCLAVLPLLGCPFPRPETLEATFELGEREVRVEARLLDLRGPADRLQAFQAVGTLLTAERAKARLEAPWISAVDAWTLSEEKGRLDLHVVARSPRAAFDRCVEDECEHALRDECAMLPLRRRCQAELYAELAKDDTDAYEALEGSVREWAPDAKRLVVKLKRVRPDEDLAAPLAVAWPLFADRPAAGRALAWMDRVDKAVSDADWAALDALGAEADTLGAAHAPLARERLRRERERRWHALLLTLEPRWLEPPPDGDWAWIFRPRVEVPAGRVPGEWKWRARASYEIWRRNPAAYEELSRELCREGWIARSRDFARFCASVGWPAPASGKAKKTGK